MIRTGLQTLDGFLSGGIPGGVVVDIFGGNGTGKTQMLLQLSANVIGGAGADTEGGGGRGNDGRRVLYVDATGGFRPERILEILARLGAGAEPGLLDRITVSRPTNTSEQVGAVRSLRGADFSLIAVDNVTDLFSYEYGGDGGIESIHQRNVLFMRHMRDLSALAIAGGIPVVVTNMVRYTMADDTEVENMRSAIDPFTHVKIHLRRDPPSGFRGRVSWALGGGGSFPYTIRRSGLSEPPAPEDI